MNKKVFKYRGVPPNSIVQNLILNSRILIIRRIWLKLCNWMPVVENVRKMIEGCLFLGLKGGRFLTWFIGANLDSKS